jgi:putative addiction module component (TIGR02574 family)
MTPYMARKTLPFTLNSGNIEFTQSTRTEAEMATAIENIDFTKLTLDERALLAHRLWESVQREAQSTPLSAAQIEEIDRRIAAADAGHMQSMPWEELKRELVSRKQ